MTEERDYNLESLPSSKHYHIEVLYDTSLGRACYHAVNSTTNVPEVPFILASDAHQILDDLESEYPKPKVDSTKGTVTQLKH